ncbi:MAG: glycosyltransferase [Gemmatimonadota bacterium]|nr:glycosyltransferase [Gemmatimonadota bacterium]
MKALFVTHSYPRFDGDSAGSFILRLAAALREQEVEVRVVAPSAAGLRARDSIQGIEVRRFRYAPGAHETLAYSGTMAHDVASSTTAKLALASFMVAETLAVRREIAEWRPDVVHAHWWFPNGVAASTASRLSGVPLVTTSHGTDLRLLRTTPAARPLARYVFGRSARVTCVSDWLARQAAEFTRTPPTIAPMPIATGMFNPTGDRDVNRLVFVGRLSEQKGIRAAIEAMSLMKRSIVLDVVGDGPDREALTHFAAQRGVADRVLWLGQVRHEQLPALLARASALLAPFTEEGLGLVAAEAQLCETPPVAFDSGGMTDVVKDNVTGLLVPTGDVRALATAAERVVSDVELRQRLGRAGRETALAKFAPWSVAAQYAHIYRDAASEASSEASSEPVRHAVSSDAK